MTRSFLPFFWIFLLGCTAVVYAQSPSADKLSVMLPTSKMLTVPTPGRIGSTNNFPAAITILRAATVPPS